MRVLTYNVGGGRKVARPLDMGLLGRLVDTTEPHLIALQEVSLTALESRKFHDHFADMGFATAMSGFTLMSDQSDYGNLVLYRGEVKEHRSIALSSSGEEPRGVIFCSVEKDGLHWVIASTHLGLRSGARQIQLEEIRRVLEEMESEGPDPGLSLLVGDLNVWNRFSRESRFLKTHFSRGKSGPTFPTIAPFIALDRVWSRGVEAFGFESRMVIKTAELRRHSDHYPLFYEFTKKGP